jgi:hypothetical protein
MVAVVVEHGEVLSKALVYVKSCEGFFVNEG